jgi:[ribosomal protein S18]-alanine N-acetyltransferase
VEESDAALSELLDGSYYAVETPAGQLAGFFCFGAAARVPPGEGVDVYEDGSYTDIGLGMRPDACGGGRGSDFLRSGLRFGREGLGVTKFRLTVAEFNLRAIKVYSRAGFALVTTFRRAGDGLEFRVMVLDQDDPEGAVTGPGSRPSSLI